MQLRSAIGSFDNVQTDVTILVTYPKIKDSSLRFMVLSSGKLPGGSGMEGMMEAYPRWWWSAVVWLL